MEMCYDGVLVMPRTYAAVNEEEMTYVDGGFYRCNNLYYSNAADAYDFLNTNANRAWAVFACGCIISVAGCALVGALTGSAPGAIIGAVVGAAIGVGISWVAYGWANELDNAAMAAARKGSRSCNVRIELNNATLCVTVS